MTEEEANRNYIKAKEQFIAASLEMKSLHELAAVVRCIR